MIYRDRPVPKDAHIYYGCTDKELYEGSFVGKEERASSMLRDILKNEWGSEPVTPLKAFRDLLGKSPYQLSYYEVQDMFRNAKNLGYLESVRM